MGYREILDRQKEKLDSSISWWPDYLYHFTDIRNAIGIIDKEWIFPRNSAVSQNLMRSDNASQSVISVTMDDAKDYARLYFRPLTPTQFHNEGYKPEHIRKHEVNASCPVPVFFCLDAEKVLRMPGTGFVEKGMAGIFHDTILSGTEAFKNLNFEKIYHNGAHERGSDITQYRHSEIVRREGIPIQDIVKKIVCRSMAEKQTLLYSIQRQIPTKYRKYYPLIEYSPSMHMFYRNGIFVQKVQQSREGLYVELNDVQLRIGKDKSTGTDVQVEIILDWIDQENGSVIKRDVQVCTLNYALHTGINVSLKEKISNIVLAEIRFDGIVMYQDYINLNMRILV